MLAAEDRRFFRHPGVDPLAVARAAWQDVRARRVVSGGSTLTMQLARLLDPRPRTLGAKLAQVALALRLELELSKREILAAYLSRAPLGNRVVGFEAGARVYLGKPASQLSPAEAALLAAIPRAPSRANPWRGGEELRPRRDAILGRMGELGWLDAATLAAALAEPVVLASDPLRFAAPHFLARVEAEAGPLEPAATRVVTTLDPELQGRVERIVARHLAELAADGVSSMAVVVVDLERREWLAWEGSGGFWTAPDGQLDGGARPAPAGLGPQAVHLRRCVRPRPGAGHGAGRHPVELHLGRRHLDAAQLRPALPRPAGCPRRAGLLGQRAGGARPAAGRSPGAARSPASGRRHDPR